MEPTSTGEHRGIQGSDAGGLLTALGITLIGIIDFVVALVYGLSAGR